MEGQGWERGRSRGAEAQGNARGEEKMGKGVEQSRNF